MHTIIIRAASIVNALGAMNELNTSATALCTYSLNSGRRMTLMDLRGLAASVKFGILGKETVVCLASQRFSSQFDDDIVQALTV